VGVECRLLLVEDDAALRSSLRLTLLDEGFEVLEAGTGRDGLASLDAAPDVVLLDLGLPDVDGIEVCRQIRAASSVPIVVISARTNPEDKAAASAAGADDYLPKPFVGSELARRVRALLHLPLLTDPGGPVPGGGPRGAL